MEYNVAMTEDLEASLRGFLLHDPSEEDICFAIWFPSAGKNRFTAILYESILPESGDRERHGNVSAFPGFVDRAKEIAREAKGGLAIIHTHPSGSGWQGLSHPDEYYEKEVLAREVFGVTGFPLVGLTLAGDGGWSARIYEKLQGKRPTLQWCKAIRIVGKNLTVQLNNHDLPIHNLGESLIRTTSVWGPYVQSSLMRLRVGVIGAGSVGSLVIEILARLGVGEIVIMDFDKIRKHNLDRLLHATIKDVGKSKARLARTYARKSATNPNFDCVAYTTYSIVEKEGYVAAKDCDVLFSCVDRPWPRQVLNHLAYSCLIPVVDGGVSFKTKDFRLIHGMFRAQTVGPSRPCLNCLGAYDAGEVQMDREGAFDDPVYIEEVRKIGAEPSRQNIMPFSVGLSSLETIQFVELITNIGRTGDLGQQPYDCYTGEILPIHTHCKPNCEFSGMVAKGDALAPYLSRDISKNRETNSKKSRK
jgi:hypothetical protein